MLAAVLEASAEEREQEPKKEWVEAIERLSASSSETYRELVYEDEGFYAFFSGASPIGELALVNIGSRPAKRVENPDVESLRAIPWVFAWTQNRFRYPPGTAPVRAQYIHRCRRRRARPPAGDVPGVAVLPNPRRLMQMTLAKSDLRIAEAYPRWSRIPASGSLWERTSEEYEMSVRSLLRITEQKTSSTTPYSATIRCLRNPYVDRSPTYR